MLFMMLSANQWLFSKQLLTSVPASTISKLLQQLPPGIHETTVGTACNQNVHDVAMSYISCHTRRNWDALHQLHYLPQYLNDSKIMT